MKISYDREFDTLYITFKKSTGVVCHEPKPGFLLRCDKSDNSLVGITIVGVRSQFSDGPMDLPIDDVNLQMEISKVIENLKHPRCFH